MSRRWIERFPCRAHLQSKSRSRRSNCWPKKKRWRKWERICRQIKLSINTSLLLLAPSVKAFNNTTNKRWESGRTTGQNRDSCSFKLHCKILGLSVSVNDRQMCQNSIPSHLKIAFSWIQEQSLKAGSRKMAKRSAKVQGGVLARVALLSLTWLDTMATPTMTTSPSLVYPFILNS